jgi:hypothetical protein
MATQGQRKRGGGAKQGGAGSPTHLPVSLVAGLQGVSQLAGNRALLSMVARSKAQVDERTVEEDEIAAPADEKEELLADERLQLEKAKRVVDSDATFDELKAALLALLSAMDGALRLADGYKGELAEQIERLMRTEDTTDRAEEALRDALHVAIERGEGIHSHLVDRLGRDDDELQLPAHLVKKLTEEVGELQEQAQGKHPAGMDALGALAGGPLLARKRRKKR